MTPLKLIALDDEDLNIISAHVQDAVLLIGDVVHLSSENRFVMAMNRFNRHGRKENEGERRRAVLHFDRVNAVRQRHIRADAPDLVLNLLALRFEPTDAPRGHVTLVFSGGGEIRLDVECIEARLSDLGPAWRTSNLPDHEWDS